MAELKFQAVCECGEKSRKVTSWTADQWMTRHKAMHGAQGARHAKGSNAEDCDACAGTNPPYPFICPGDDRYRETGGA